MGRKFSTFADRWAKVRDQARADSEALHKDTNPNRELTVFISDNSHVLPSKIVLSSAFTLSFRKNLEFQEYKKQAEYFIKAGVDHYLCKLDKNIGPKQIEDMKYFSERPDLEGMPT